MPLYFTDLTNGDQTIADDEGKESTDIEAAREEALRLATQATHLAAHSGEVQAITTTIRDEEGIQRYRVTLTLKGEWLE